MKPIPSLPHQNTYSNQVVPYKYCGNQSLNITRYIQDLIKIIQIKVKAKHFPGAVQQLMELNIWIEFWKFQSSQKKLYYIYDGYYFL